VDLAFSRPLAGPEHPEGRPVAEAVARVGLLDRGGDLELAARRRADVGRTGLDPARGPVAAGAVGGDVQVAVPVQVDVAGRVGHGLDLAGAEVRAGTGVVDPVAVHPRAGRPLEIVAEL